MQLKYDLPFTENRNYGITKMNQRSSRSHTIFRMVGNCLAFPIKNALIFTSFLFYLDFGK